MSSLGDGTAYRNFLQHVTWFNVHDAQKVLAKHSHHEGQKQIKLFVQYATGKSFGGCSTIPKYQSNNTATLTDLALINIIWSSFDYMCGWVHIQYITGI